MRSEDDGGTQKIESLTDELFAQLEARIRSGELIPGQRLPTQKDIGDMQDALHMMFDARVDPVLAMRADTDFPLAIARATQNEYYVRLIGFIGLMLAPPRNIYLRGQDDEAQAGYAAKVQSEHEAILDAIVRMDPARAREAARAHMQESLTRHSMLSASARTREKPA